MKQLRRGHPPEVLDSVVEVIAVPDAPAADRAPWAADVRGITVAFGFALRVLFFATAPFVVSVFCYLLQLHFLAVLMLVTVALTGVIGNSSAVIRRFPWLRRVPLVGDALRIFVRMRQFYVQHRPRSFLYYACYPVTGPLAMVFSRTSRQEFRLYSGILLSMLVALVTTAVLSYRTTYPPHLGLGEALGEVATWCAFTVALVYVFFTSLATTSFTYRLSGRLGLLRILLVLGVLSASIPLLMVWQSPPSHSFRADVLLQFRLRKPSFRAELGEALAMFLRYQHAQFDPARDVQPADTARLTHKLQQHLSGLMPGDENRAFEVVALPPEGPGGDRRLWLGTRALLGSAEDVQWLTLVGPDGALHTSWRDLPAPVQQTLRGLQRSAPKGPGARPRRQLRAETLLEDLE